ncbi:MAG: sodium:solute symporter [Bacteroidetes bacterium]|nr:sodium:solute symporter [Bacteroidota bacterium]
MHWIDWLVLIGTLVLIAVYGVWKTRMVSNTESYLLGDRELKWWTIGLSIMATQASAITFLSTPGQAYESGMGFAQFYFGLPIAMVILAAFVIPQFYRLKVYTAYEFLETRFDLRTRTLTALIFLLQRGLSAGITIFAPAIILSAILGWPLGITNLAMGGLVIVYTVSGGTNAVSQTQKQQMIIILSGMFIAAIILLRQLPTGVGMSDALSLTGQLGKLELIDLEFSFENRYNIWSGLFASTFLFLSYFGADQSQVQRYLSGRTLTESRLGLLFNGIIKVPMQVLVLFVGLLVFVFFQFEKPPIHFNDANLRKISAMEVDGRRPYADSLQYWQERYDAVFEARSAAVDQFVVARAERNAQGEQAALMAVREHAQEDSLVREEVKAMIKRADKSLNTLDSDYVFITFVTEYLPVGLVGLLLAVIFSAAMSSTASEINALATATMVDLYRRSLFRGRSDAHYLRMSKWLTLGWGLIALAFASMASLFDNLVEAVNIVGSIFYGTVLGIFAVAFFFKKTGARAVFYAALLAQVAVIVLFWMHEVGRSTLTFLWLVPIGCFLVIGLSALFNQFLTDEPFLLPEQDGDPLPDRETKQQRP